MAKHPSGTKQPSKTRQEFQTESHLPTMMRRWQRQGVLDEALRPRGFPHYGDFSNVSDYKTALDAVADAKQAFMTLDPRVREFFHNDPHRLLEALGDESQTQNLIDLGIFENPRVEADLPDPQPDPAPEPDPEP